MVCDDAGRSGNRILLVYLGDTHMILIDEHEFQVMWGVLSLLGEEKEQTSENEISYLYKDANGGKIGRVVIEDTRSQIILWDSSGRRAVFEMVKK